MVEKDRKIEKLIAEYTPFPMCILNPQGKVTRASARIDEVFLYDGILDADIFVLTGIKYAEFQRITDPEEDRENPLTLQRNGKVFKLEASMLGDDEDAGLALYFHDITNFETLKKIYNDEKICMAIVNVDNYDELSSNTSDDKKLTVTTEIDKAIRQWCAGINGSITRYKEHMYMIAFENRYCDKLVENRFSILDDIRLIETEADFPVTLSIGIGVGGKTPAQCDQFAADALDLALGRGGDQAVIKRGSKLEYYGGKAAAVEKSNKGKSRIMAHAMKQLIEQSSKVIIMGHKNPDMDSFGAALGVHRMCANSNKDAFIVLNYYNDTLTMLYEQAVETDLYTFINSEKAKAIVDRDTLLVIVDTHRPSIMECADLLTETDKIIVIDHHRKIEESVENATLSYMEAYASSASELVAEILQYSVERKNITKLEAEALLAGITVDTNRFAVKTGVRTFEAASWLRRSGADTTSVKRFFQTDVTAFNLRAQCVANARFLFDGIVVSICEGKHVDAQIINSQAADELLGIKGIKASFVIGTNDKGRTVISARSLGEMNVQMIMEKFGGGGHLTTAGAQVDMTPEETIVKLREVLAEFLSVKEEEE